MAPPHAEPACDDPADLKAEIPAFLLPLLADLEHVDPFELDARLRRGVRLEQRLGAELASLARRVTSSEFGWKERYQTLETLARECLGMSPSKLRALMRVERLGDACPALRDAYRDGQLSWVQADRLARLFAADVLDGSNVAWRAAWVVFASSVTVRRLADAIDRACLWRDADPDAFVEHRGDPEVFAEPGRDEMPTERQTCARPRDLLGGIRLQISAPNDVARLFEAALCSVRLAIERVTGQQAPASVAFEAMLDHALESWGVDDRWLRRQIGKQIGKRHYELFERDDWRCVFPGCTSRRNLQIHHIVFRSAGGSDEPANLTTLCAFHHQRGVHSGTVSVRGRAPNELEFELGVRAGHPPLARFRSGDRVA